MPPSSDDVPGRKPPSRQQRRAAERSAPPKRGQPPRAPGPALSWGGPDPAGAGPPGGAVGGGADPAGAAGPGGARAFPQLELPAMAAERVQHDLHRARCGCGREHVAARPAGVPDSAVSIGPRLSALAVYLMTYQHVPVERCRELIADVTGAGDTVMATMALALGAGATFELAAHLANYAGGLVVMKRGTATVTGAELLRAVRGTASLDAGERKRRG